MPPFVVQTKIVPDETIIEGQTPMYMSLYDENGAPISLTGLSGELDGVTVDTGQHFRLIQFSNGTVKAIPYTTPDPVAPTDLDAVIRIASVALSWAASPTSGATYVIFRDGVQIGTTTSLTYRDNSVIADATYVYKVQTSDVYGQRSDFTDELSAFIDPDLNQAPIAFVTAWPPTYHTDGKTLIRVNGYDPDAQSLAIALEVDSGFLQATDDPSVWYYTPA